MLEMPANKQPTSKLSLFILLAILVGGLVLYFGINFYSWPISRLSRKLYLVILCVNIAFYMWARAFSGLSTSRQVASIAAFVFVQLAIFPLVVMDGLAGDGKIITKWRWSPTPEEQFVKYTTGQAETFVPSELRLNVVTESDVPAFRGTARNGRYVLSSFDLDWENNSPQELWRHPIGRGWCSFAAVGNCCVTLEQRDKEELVVCYDIRTGHEIWSHAEHVRFQDSTSGAGPRATPAIDGGRVYALGATGILNCLNGETGEPIWTVHVNSSSEEALLYGHASSPLVIDGKVIVATGRNTGKLIAYDALTGDLVWSETAGRANYSSPMLLEFADHRQILNFDAAGLNGHDMETGQLLWSHPWGEDSDEFVNVGQPVVLPTSATKEQEARILICAAYGRGTALLRVVAEEDVSFSVEEIWHTKALQSKFSSIVALNEFAFGLNRGILTCIDLSDGRRRWKKGRYGFGQLATINDLLLVQAEKGDIHLVNVSGEEISRLDGLSDRTWNHPIVTKNRLLIRNDREAICFELPVQ